jgi:hypothetical protein
VGFFRDLTTQLDRTGPGRRTGSGGGLSEVLKYAPTRLRARTDFLGQLDSETHYWKTRAHLAESRLMSIEDSIRGLASLPAATHKATSHWQCPAVASLGLYRRTESTFR